jgi:hypothetical protein
MAWKFYNATGAPLAPGAKITVFFPDKLPDGPRIPSSGLVAPPIAAASMATSVPLDLGTILGFRGLVLTPTGWSDLNNKLSAPAVCGIYWNKSVVLSGEIDHEGDPGAVYYAGLADGSIVSVPPAPVTEADPEDEQWVRVLGLQISATKVLVRPDVIPIRPLPVAMCQGTSNFNYRLARFGNF